ncbi:hypothetical protein GS518_02875 [Leptospira interrogans]|nr:hypothetical protein [Leptospira interrogans serovar Copenhageni]QHH27344.1 hypothetical protein GS520_02860 [Leptospira interrogans]QHH30994.1 hypothetical protein GS525_02900 [Leptospira interrogans]QHH34629.1 hypothetical protein GS519_02900 [Leptospira interrogans]QHH38262.1 hypothetical protein GS526_02895 [Leptospira interrogans]
MQKPDCTIILFVFSSSSHNFQSLTGEPTICSSSHIYFSYEKIDLR